MIHVEIFVGSLQSHTLMGKQCACSVVNAFPSSFANITKVSG